MLDLAQACHQEMSAPSEHPAIKAKRAAVRTHADAKRYLDLVAGKIRERRKKKKK